MSALPRLIVSAHLASAPDSSFTLDLTPVFVRFSRQRIEAMIGYYAAGKPEAAEGLRIIEISNCLDDRVRDAAFRGELCLKGDLAVILADWFDAIGRDPQAAGDHVRAIETCDYRIRNQERRLDGLRRHTIGVQDGDADCWYCDRGDSFEHDIDCVVEDRARDSFGDVAYVSPEEIEAAIARLGPIYLHPTKQIAWSGFTPETLDDLVSPEAEIEASLHDHHEDAIELVEDEGELTIFLETWAKSKGYSWDELETLELSEDEEKALLADEALIAFLKAWNERQNITSYFPQMSRMIVLNAKSEEPEAQRAELVAKEEAALAQLKQARQDLAASWRVPAAA